MKQLNQDIELIKTKGYVYYVKWISTFFVLFAVICRSVEEVPKIYDVGFSLIGTLGWLYVGLAWKDRALIMLNAVITVMLSAAFLRGIL
jgi:hypothetical protein